MPLLYYFFSEMKSLFQRFLGKKHKLLLKFTDKLKIVEYATRTLLFLNDLFFHLDTKCIHD